jgi:hypothetical protein
LGVGASGLGAALLAKTAIWLTVLLAAFAGILLCFRLEIAFRRVRTRAKNLSD